MYRQLNFINSESISKLVTIACSYEENFGGKAACLCLLILFGQPRLTMATGHGDNRDAEFASFRDDIRSFKASVQQLQQIHAYNEMGALLETAITKNQ